MAKLREIVQKIRSKNAGPFWITIDIFCGSRETFTTVCQRLTAQRSEALTQAKPGTLRRFEIENLAVLKISVPREHIQGSRFDRDMHGAQLASLFAELEL